MRESSNNRPLEVLVARVNGFVYQGDRLNAVVSAIDALREDPALAARLVGPSGGVTRYEFTHDPEHGPFHDHQSPDSTHMRAVTVHTGPWNRIHSGQ